VLHCQLLWSQALLVFSKGACALQQCAEAAYVTAGLSCVFPEFNSC
jgi:hypothetical protein